MKNFKTINIIVLFFVLMMTSFASQAMTPSEYDELCRQDAVEDQVPEEELAVYIATCIQNIADEQAADSSDQVKESSTD